MDLLCGSDIITHMKYDGRALNERARKWGVKPTPLAVAAGMSSSNLSKVFSGKAPIQTYQTVRNVLESLIQQKIQEEHNQDKAAS